MHLVPWCLSVVYLWLKWGNSSLLFCLLCSTVHVSNIVSLSLLRTKAIIRRWGRSCQPKQYQALSEYLHPQFKLADEVTDADGWVMCGSSVGRHTDFLHCQSSLFFSVPAACTSSWVTTASLHMFPHSLFTIVSSFDIMSRTTNFIVN